jgi:uncharacterized membrane protein (DUF106 family)
MIKMFLIIIIIIIIIIIFAYLLKILDDSKSSIINDNPAALSSLNLLQNTFGNQVNVFSTSVGFYIFFY